jgi:hypothetical protein
MISPKRTLRFGQKSYQNFVAQNLKKGKEQFVPKFEPKKSDFRVCWQAKMSLKTKVDTFTSTLMEATEEKEGDKPADVLKMNLNILIVDVLVSPNHEKSDLTSGKTSEIWNEKTKTLNLSALDFQFSEAEVLKKQKKLVD